MIGREREESLVSQPNDAPYGSVDQPQHQGYSQPPSASPYLTNPAGTYGTPHGYYPGVPPTSTNPWAIAAFVLSLFGTAIFAVVAGHIALSQINRTQEQGRGFAIAGLVIGYLEIVLWVIIAVAFFGLLRTTT